MKQFKIHEKQTYTDWGLFLHSFEVGAAEVKTNYISLPIGDGTIDLTEAVRGEVSYSDREIRATFTTVAPRSSWRALLDEIAAYTHGRKYKITVPDDPDHYYMGRVQVWPLIKSAASASFDITVTAEPYKYKNEVTSHDFTIDATGTKTVPLTNSRKRVYPTFIVSADTQIVFGAVSIVIDNTAPRTLTQIAFVQGANEITFNAAAGTTVNVSYQEGVL